MRTFVATLSLAGLLAGCGCGGPEAQRLATVEIEIAGETLAIECARTEAERATGMMHRRELGPDEGMLFVVPEPRLLGFYMKNTHVPLDIAFIREDGMIDRIAPLEPLREEPVHSRNRCLYALEMPRGWFAAHGVVEGDKVGIPAEVAGE